MGRWMVDGGTVGWCMGQWVRGWGLACSEAGCEDKGQAFKRCWRTYRFILRCTSPPDTRPCREGGVVCVGSSLGDRLGSKHTLLVGNMDPHPGRTANSYTT